MMIDGKEVVTSGRVVRIARLRAEYYEFVENPEHFCEQLKQAQSGADVFSFLQRVWERDPRFEYALKMEGIAVLPITSYEQWWKTQINDKTRNMIRRAQKKGIEVRRVEFNDELVRGIVELYNETPVRQGKPFLHYGKDFDAIQKDHCSYLDRSDFIGAYLGQELAGFIKLVHGSGVSNLMQIIAKVAHRDKAPTNALIAKAVELCAQRQVPLLHYGLWSRRGLGEFKKHHAFQRFDVPRYYVPLNAKGKLALSLKLHRKAADFLPERLLDSLAEMRGRWNAIRFRKRQA